MRYKGESPREFGIEAMQRPREHAQRALMPDRMPNRALTQKEAALVADEAAYKGAAAAAATAACSAALVYKANARYAALRLLGAGPKSAMIAVPTIGAFALKSHLVVAHANADPSRYFGQVPDDDVKQIVRRPSAGLYRTSLSSMQKFANFVYENPFKVILGISAPMYGAIFYRECTHPDTASMLLSQRVIHTRVYGQAIAIATTIGVTAFTKSMDANGGPYQIAAPPHSSETAKLSAESYVNRVGAGESRNREARLELLSPMLYVPLIAGLGIGLRNRIPREQLTKIILGTVGIGLAHAGYIQIHDSTM